MTAPESKWIAGTSPNQPVSEAALKVLTARLDAVIYWLPLAALEPSEDIENVHQLRVSTRRAMAALKVFGDLLPSRRRRWLKRQLKHIRRAAGVARDLDVLSARMDDFDVRNGARDMLLETLQARRVKAQKPIVKIHDKLGGGVLKTHCEEMLERLRWQSKRDEPSFEQAAYKWQRPVIKRFFKASRADFTDVEKLHAFRIAGKELRYTMEIFIGAMPESYRSELYPKIETVQGKLGEINDHASTIRNFHEWLVECDDNHVSQQMVELLRKVETQLDRDRKRFAAWFSRRKARRLKALFDESLSARTVRDTEKA